MMYARHPSIALWKFYFRYIQYSGWLSNIIEWSEDENTNRSRSVDIVMLPASETVAAKHCDTRRFLQRHSAFRRGHQVAGKCAASKFTSNFFWEISILGRLLLGTSPAM